MATAEQLKSRWLEGRGAFVKESLVHLLGASGGRISLKKERYQGFPVDWESLLEGLPFREEVPNGKDLRGIVLGGRLWNADFSGIDFSYAVLGLHFHQSNLCGARFDFADVEGQSFHDNLDGCSFRGADLRNADLADSNVRNCCFDKAKLSKASLNRSNLSNSSFINANLIGANLNGSNLQGCNFQGALFKNATLTDTLVDKATDFRGANLLNAWHEADYHQGKLISAGLDWSKVTYDETTLFGEDEALRAIEQIQSALRALDIEYNEYPNAEKLRNVLHKKIAQLQKGHRPKWGEEIFEETGDEMADFITAVFSRMYKYPSEEE